MPNPAFVPLIGSSFDQLGNQRLAWSGFNRQIEEGNIARQVAAQEQANQWAMAQQAAQQRAYDEQAAQQAALTQHANDQNEAVALARYNEGVRQKERAQDLAASQKQWEERLAAENKRTDATSANQDKTLALRQQLQDDAIAARGQNFAQQYAAVARAAQQADEAHGTAEGDLNDIQDQIKNLTEKNTPAERLALNNDLKIKQRDLKPALAAKQKADAALNRMLDAMAAHDYSIDEENGSVIHTPSGKSWSYKTAIKKAAEDAVPFTLTDTNPVAPFIMDLGAQSPALSPADTSTGVNPWAGFNSQTNAPPRQVWTRDANGRPIPVQ